MIIQIKYRILILLITLLIGIGLNGQEQENFSWAEVRESVYLSTDRDLYIAGEDILFSVEYFINGSKQPLQLSNIVYVELISASDNKPVVQKKYKLVNLNASGRLQIPSDVASGNFMVTAYTQYQRNFSNTNFSYHFITVLNPENNSSIGFEEPGDSLQKQNPDPAFIPAENVESIAIQTEKEQYKPRETVKSKITYKSNQTDNPVFISVSVTRAGTQKEDHGFLPSFYSVRGNKAGISQYDPNLGFIPEVRDVSISGILRNKETLEPVSGHPVYISVIFNNPQLHVKKTNTNGAFIFSLNNVTGINDVFLCPEKFPNDENKYEILINNSFSNDYVNFGNVRPFVNSADMELIREVYENAQIRKQFCGNLHADTIRREKSSLFNISTNKTTTMLSDFVSLKSMEELFTEIVYNVKFKKSRGQYSFTVFDRNGNVFSENPLLLLDKIPIFNPNVIMELDVSQIEKVEVINRTYLLGENTFQGVVMLSTNNNNIAGISLPESGIFVEYQTIEPAFDLAASFCNCNPEEERIPDFRTTLYWNPHIELTGEGAEIVFDTSDATGIYNIVAKGFTKDGKSFYSKKQIKVAY